jgi:hypothetical protein
MFVKNGMMCEDLHARPWFILVSGIVALMSVVPAGSELLRDVQVSGQCIFHKYLVQRHLLEETQGDYYRRRQFAMSERYIEVFLRLICEKSGGRGAHPRKSEDRGNCVSVSHVVMVHDVVHVLKSQPIVGSEKIQRTERRRSTNHRLVTAKLLPAVIFKSTEHHRRLAAGYLHGYNISGGEVEGRREIVEACANWLRVCRFVFL